MTNALSRFLIPSSINSAKRGRCCREEPKWNGIVRRIMIVSCSIPMWINVGAFEFIHRTIMPFISVVCPCEGTITSISIAMTKICFWISWREIGDCRDIAIRTIRRWDPHHWRSFSDGARSTRSPSPVIQSSSASDGTHSVCSFRSIFVTKQSTHQPRRRKTILRID